MSRLIMRVIDQLFRFESSGAAKIMLTTDRQCVIKITVVQVIFFRINSLTHRYLGL